MSETLVCVADEIGIRVWLERVLETEWNLETVSSRDLSRVSRLVHAHKAPVVLIAIDEADASRALRVFGAIQKASPAAHLVGVTQRISQDLLLSIMRNGARDCLITGLDSDTAVDRIRKVVETVPSGVGTGGHQKRGQVTLVGSTSELVDTRFFSQNLVCALNEITRGESILAIDASAAQNKTFYFDNLNRLTLADLIARGDSIDRAFIETALEEYPAGLRLLSGNLTEAGLSGDAAADLFIALTQLAGLFDRVVIRADARHIESWLGAMGADLSGFILLSHPAVDQIQNVENLLQNAKEWLSDRCRTFVVIDGYDKRATLSQADIEKKLPQPCALTLPLEWRFRLDAINAGIPMSAVPQSSQYDKKLKAFVRTQFLAGESVGRSFANIKAMVWG